MRCAAQVQESIVANVGQKIGAALKRFLPATGGPVEFLCPLDEGLARVVIDVCPYEKPGLVEDSLPNSDSTWGKFGRFRCGGLELRHMEAFFSALAVASGIGLVVERRRGVNAHHIIESTFKAISRCLRKVIDGAKSGR